MGSPDPVQPRLTDLLYQASSSSCGLTFYGKDTETSATYLSYRKLLDIAHAKSKQISSLPGAGRETVVFLHFTNFQENVEWFWGVVLAGLLPAVSTQLPADASRRRNHLTHVIQVLKQPIILTSRELAGDFDGLEKIRLTIVEDLIAKKATEAGGFSNHRVGQTEAAALMLTSGSSGNAKAVVLRHEQIVKSVRGKCDFFGTTPTDIFLNWIGFDHVASIIETHVHAMSLGAGFVHVPAPTLLADPILFLQLIDKYRITYTFAPHFFLVKLLRTLEGGKEAEPLLDISCLRYLVSGGESNGLEIAVALTKALQVHNLKHEVIIPGFGMTETCAGSFYGKNCPSYDMSQGNAFASLGKPIPGMQMRIAPTNNSEPNPGEVGDLQLSGQQVFQEYFNNIEASTSCYTDDGWFITGDRAYVDMNGNLNIAGREKESINLNGLKYFPNEIESALDTANIDGLIPSWTVVFSRKPSQASEEEICVVYLPKYGLDDIAKRVETARAIVYVVGRIIFTRPKHIIPLPRYLLHKSALGKLSRAKVSNSFAKGEFEQYEDSKSPAISKFRAEQREQPASATEYKMFEALQEVLDISDELGVNDSLFDFGLTSTGLFSFKKKIEKDIALRTTIPVGMLLTTPTVRGIAHQLEKLRHNIGAEYNPVVPLQSSPANFKPPLWLVHPGSGDVLVFVGLAKYFPERTVYGLRTRGLNTELEGSGYFTNIAEIADTYVEHIKKHQPHGPYALAGYSLGSTVAFEIAKRLQVTSNEVKFLGLFDSPPHMRKLIEKLDWIDVLLNVAYFLELISEDLSENIAPHLRGVSQDEALDFVINRAPQDRLEVLELDKTRLQKVTNVTNAFGLAGKRYDPEGLVQSADVFWVTPLLSVARSRAEWMDKHLIYWKDFVAEPPRFHECQGVHSKMLNSEYVGSFQVVLKEAMARRGI